MKHTILVTGGCGYVGSHVVRMLSETGYQVVVIDNLSTGFRSALLHNEALYVADLCTPDAYRHVFAKYRFSAIMDFAASIVVPESVAEPLDYYRNNVVSLIGLLCLAKEFQVPAFVFSSTAAVYGDALTALTPTKSQTSTQTITAAVYGDALTALTPTKSQTSTQTITATANGDALTALTSTKAHTNPQTINEACPLAPTNPYGWSKVFGEQILQDAAKATGIKVTCLRYFNVAGAHPQARIGQRAPNATHLIKIACEVALGKRPSLGIYGRDYPTKDGTGVRDYIHVEDLASIHLLALEDLLYNKASTGHTMNCGYGKGFSVLEVIQVMESITKRPLLTFDAARRPGDPATLIADVSKFRSLFPAWQPGFASLETIINTALAWERTLLP